MTPALPDRREFLRRVLGVAVAGPSLPSAVVSVRATAMPPPIGPGAFYRLGADAAGTYTWVDIPHLPSADLLDRFVDDFRDVLPTFRLEYLNEAWNGRPETGLDPDGPRP
jgi:hypothetical protein